MDSGVHSAAWPFLIAATFVGVVLAAIFGNLPVLLFLAAGLLIILRFAYKIFLRPYLRALRMRRAREARALRDAINSAQPSDS
jgi:F0F1-type ATP synthase membrane subunit b/b'